jgi:hypothetical protein
LAAAADSSPGFGPLAILAGVAGLLLVYGYPLWVVFASGLSATVNAKRMTSLPLLGLALLVVAQYLAYPDGQNTTDSQASWWQIVLGGVFGVSLFLPLWAAAATLHAAEVKRGIRRSAGGVTAFLWFFYFFLGWGPLHKRVRAAAGVED